MELAEDQSTAKGFILPGPSFYFLQQIHKVFHASSMEVITGHDSQGYNISSKFHT